MLPRLPVIAGFRAGHPRPFCSLSQAKIWIARPASQDSWSATGVAWMSQQLRERVPDDRLREIRECIIEASRRLSDE
jgi:hypothetical protein